MTPSSGRLLPVKLEVFEGPLDLLLHLIERNEVEISAISLVLVVEQYMQYLQLMRAELKLEAAAEFLVVAGKLLLIKSRSLLPRVEAPLEAEEDDPAEELARQLEEYRQFKQIADELRALKDTRGQTFARTATSTEPVAPRVTLVGLDADRLVAAFRKALERVAEQTLTGQELPGPRITQTERIGVIEAGLTISRTMPFDRLLGDCRTVEDVIVTFLAVLELLKQARIRVWQAANFGAIILSRPARHA